MLRLTISVMHIMALVPLVTMLTLRRRHSFGRQRWLIAGALASSWVPDLVSRILSYSGYDPAIIVTQIFTPIQIGVVLYALTLDTIPLMWTVLGVSIVAGSSALQGAPAYELVVAVVGGIVVACLAWRMDRDLTRAGLIVYFGTGAVAWSIFALVATEPTLTALVSWYAYQSTRLVGILLITAALILCVRKPQLELVMNTTAPPRELQTREFSNVVLDRSSSGLMRDPVGLGGNREGHHRGAGTPQGIGP